MKMRTIIAFVSITSPFVFIDGAAVPTATAQQAVAPAPDPVVGPAPSAPDGTQETHDEVSILQLMKVVDLSRLVAGGMSQLFHSAEGQRALLEAIRGAQIGPKNFPVLNDPADIEAQKGGDGLQEMANSALDGAAEGPQDVVDALNQFRSIYDLDNALKLKDDELPGKKMLAQLAAKGVVASSSAEAAYKRANASNARLNTFTTALEASPDLKTSIDLNTRVTIELTKQTNESLRVQSAITSVIGSFFMVLASEGSEPSWVDGLKNFNR